MQNGCSHRSLALSRPQEEYKEVYKKTQPNVTDAEYDTLWSKIDADGDGNLTVKELAKYYGFSWDGAAPSGFRAALWLPLAPRGPGGFFWLLRVPLLHPAASSGLCGFPRLVRGPLAQHHSWIPNL